MKNRQLNSFKAIIILGLLQLCSIKLLAQMNTSVAGTRTNLNGTQRDSTHNKSNDNAWKDEEAVIEYELPNSAKRYTPDTDIHVFQRRPFQQPWYRDLGNPGSPANNLVFTPEYHVGPSLGYHIFDIYRYVADSLKYYNTTRPYSVFTYHLGSKLEQVAGIMHTQNIKPNWNFMVEYRKINAPGFYKIQRNNFDNFCFTTNFKSLDKHYTLYAGMTYNKEQHDENGGIVNDSELDNVAYIDRRTVDAAYQNGQYSITRSTVSNMQRDFNIVLHHSYLFGNTDTTYNADSTEYSYHLKPRFSITHNMQLSTEKHIYKDLAPDSFRYVSLFNAALPSAGTAYYVPNGDSVVTQQKWFWIDNSILLNGFIGKDSNQLKFSAGIGNRFDEFISDPVIGGGRNRNRLVNNYITGELKKEALRDGSWGYGGKATFFVTGEYAGNFDLNASIGKDFKDNNGRFVAGFQQLLGSSPYSLSNYLNRYANLQFSFNSESITCLNATLESSKLRLSGGVRNYVLANYLYVSEKGLPDQYAPTANISQLWIRKVFRVGYFYLDNELVGQQTTENTPVNIPAFMGRHQLTYERYMFKHALKITTGAEVRYNTAYKPAGYSALLNRFYYQNSKEITNTPEVSIFLNFKLKHFRAFIMLDQVQQLLAKNTILYTGTPIINFINRGQNFTPVYAAQNTMLRMGLSWVLVN